MIIYRNENGKEYILSRTDIRVLELNGVDELNNNIVTTKSINQDGTSYSSSNIDERDIEIVLRIISNTEQYRVIKNDLYNLFNPKLDGELIISNDYGYKIISTKVINSPKFIVKNNKKECRISLIALDPYFKSILIGEEIATWIGGFSFKFKLPMRFREKGETNKNICNGGHVDTPVKIYFHGPAINPSIINNTTGEFIKVNTTISTGEILIINTEYGNKTVEIDSDGIVKNAFKLIDLDSNFFSLVSGDNLIEYTTDNPLDTQKVEIRYKERYIGV
ncbi:MAG: phage tail family protein [Paraclostridium sp.]